MQLILEKLKNCGNRETTKSNYLSIWRHFNKFILRLDRRPDSWEERVSLFCAFLINEGRQSSTIKSYVSAIKYILVNDGYTWDNTKILLTTLAKSCRLINDRVNVRLPIRMGLLEMIMSEMEKLYKNQYYLEIMYKAMFILGYYGLLRVGELTSGSHPIKAKDVHVAKNKQKILIILYSSKTHGLYTLPQKIKITANNNYQNRKFLFCPFQISREYMAIRGSYTTDDEPLFIFSDRTPVTPVHMRTTLRNAIEAIDLDPKLYNCHSLRIGRCSDMVLKFGWSISEAKRAGRWRSNAVFRYIRVL